MAEVLGVDIGGANLKAASSDIQAVTLAFPLWKQPEKLIGGLIDLLLRFSDQGPIAVTMTGELCDCFADKPTGSDARIASSGTVLRGVIHEVLFSRKGTL